MFFDDADRGVSPVQLNESQREAIEHFYGPALVLSGAGSGKTLVIVERIIRILKRGINATSIVALTFTNKAADEMRDRVMTAMPDSVSYPHLSTFHSFCLKYLRIYGKSIGVDDFEVIDSNDQKKIQRQVLVSLNINAKMLNEYHYRASCIKNGGFTEKDEIAGFLKNFYDGEEFHEFYRSYQETLKKQHLMDFDDILMYFYCLLKQGDVRDRIMNRYSFIMVDEYQDTNRIQYLILKELSSPHKNLFVVGDDDQSIYGFRGACVDNILDFQRDYPDARIIKLEKNYRSKGIILKLANFVIMNNKGRMEKELKATKDYGNPIPVLCSMKPEDEARQVSRCIFELLDRGYEYRDIAVLYRTNAQSRELEDALRENRINHKVIGNVGFYERKEIKDIIAYLKFLVNPCDLTSLKRIINTPPRRIGEKTFLIVEKAFERTDNLHIVLLKEKNPNIRIFAQLLKGILSLAGDSACISSLVEYIIKETKYYDYLEEHFSDFESRIENLDSFISYCRGYEKRAEGSDIRAFMDNLSLISDQDNLNKSDNAVRLLTVHTAKGLEFPVVFIVGMEEEIFPHRRCQYEPQELEEERRLFYVASTRAKDALFLSFSRTRFLFGSSQVLRPSRFLKEIPRDIISPCNIDSCLYDYVGFDPMPPKPAKETGCRPDVEKKAYRPSQVVRHIKYGKGIIQAINNRRVLILFTDLNCCKEFALDTLDRFLVK